MVILLNMPRQDGRYVLPILSIYGSPVLVHIELPNRSKGFRLPETFDPGVIGPCNFEIRHDKPHNKTQISEGSREELTSSHFAFLTRSPHF